MGSQGNERKWEKAMKRNVWQTLYLEFGHPHDNDHLGVIINFYASKSGNFLKFWYLKIFLKIKIHENK